MSAARTKSDLCGDIISRTHKVEIIQFLALQPFLLNAPKDGYLKQNLGAVCSIWTFSHSFSFGDPLKFTGGWWGWFEKWSLPSLEKYLGFNALHRHLLLIQNSYKMVVLMSSIFWLIESALDEVPIFKGFEFCKLLKAGWAYLKNHA